MATATTTSLRIHDIALANEFQWESGDFYDTYAYAYGLQHPICSDGALIVGAYRLLTHLRSFLNVIEDLSIENLQHIELDLLALLLREPEYRPLYHDLDLIRRMKYNPMVLSISRSLR